ncbi:protein kinase [bacterium]|nr:protein kinase [bacterium]
MAESRAGDIFQPGDLLNSTYRIETILGRGGTSEVYKARNDISGRFVAIKVLKSEFAGDEAFLTLMRREEEIREIRHDAVVRYSENHRTPEGLVYLVMDYVDGPGLDSILKQGGLSADDLVRVCRRVVDGLKVAHDRRIIHRDLSPDNIILKGGKADQAVIIDFGIAKDANPGAQTIVGNEFAGKYAYAAPEQLAGNTDTRSDLYSLGALLLATFRGKRPDPGANPMEVVRRKQERLDTSGVPEPLKSLIEKMADPDPAKRFQSADEVLRAIDQGMQAPPAMEDRTVVVPRAAAPGPATAAPSAAALATAAPVNPYATAPRPAAQAATKPAAPPPAAPAPATRSRSGLILVLVLLVLIGGGAGAWFSGALDRFMKPALPVADPYALIIERPANGAPRAVGDVPSPEVSAALTQAMAAIGGTSDLTLASGAIGASWGTDVLSVVKALNKVDSWRVAVTGNQAAVTGSTTDPAVQTAVLAAIGTLPGVLQGKAQIDVAQKVPQFLTAADIAPVLTQMADCGPLSLTDPPAVGYGKGETITVTGRLARPEKQVQLFDAISAIAPERKVDLKIELLNPALCQIETTLPAAHEGKFSFAFGYGDSSDDNPSGRYFVGENPVIDLIIPADVTTGYVSVAIIDVSGNVYHLLPNLNRKDNAVADLRKGATGEAKVRIAYPLSDNKDPSHIAFTVDPTTLGKSKVIVIHSEKPLFPELRPTTESVGGFADALKQAVDSGNLQILSLNSRILTSIAK